MGVLVKILHEMPKNYAGRDFYVTLYQQMAGRLLSLQQPDGLWRTSLLDPDAFPGGEGSGSGFHCYALAWGINHKLLDRNIFLPAVKKAWEGLNSLLKDDGKVGWVQPIGGDPRRNFNADRLYNCPSGSPALGVTNEGTVKPPEPSLVISFQSPLRIS